MQGGTSKRRKIAPGAKLVVQRHGGGGGAIRSYNAAEKAAETQVRQQGKKEIWKAYRQHSPNEKDESASPEETQAPSRAAAVQSARDAIKQRTRASKALAKSQTIAGRSKQVMKDIADYKAKRKQNLKDSRNRLKKFKAAAPKRRAAALAKRQISQQEQSEAIKDCLKQLESFTLKPKEPAKFVGLDVPKSRYLVKGKASGKS